MIVANLSPDELEGMGRTQDPQKKRFILKKTQYRMRKIVIIPVEIGGKKIKVKTEVVEGEILLIIGKEEYGMTTDMKKKKKRRIGEKETRVRWRDDSKGHMREEVRQRKKSKVV